jgi:hypothetical protein
MSKKPAWKLQMKYPEGWIQLPIARKIEVGTWAEQAAWETLEPSATDERAAARVEHLVQITNAARANHDWSGLAYFPSYAHTLVALLDVKAYVPDGQYKTTTLDVLEEIFGGPAADTVGEKTVEREQLPGGPALRIRRMRAEPGDPTGQSTIMEEVTHVIHPPGINGAVQVCMTWTVLQLGDKLAAMADAIAKTVRVTPE